MRGRTFNGNRRRSWTVIQPLTVEPATERIGWDSEIPTSGANSPDPAQDGQASDRQGRPWKLGRPFRVTIRYVRLCKIMRGPRNAISSFLFQKIRWSDRITCTKILKICQAFSFARRPIPPWNHFADSKI